MSIYDNLKINSIKKIKLHVEDNSATIENIVDGIIKPYSKDLDAYIHVLVFETIA